MREKNVETKLVAAIQKAGGLCWKFTSPGTAGVPDRIVILPGGRVAFIEVKAPGEKPRPIQNRRAQQIRALGVPVLTIDNPDQIPGAISEISAP